jgi:hypothetical protein
VLCQVSPCYKGVNTYNVGLAWQPGLFKLARDECDQAPGTREAVRTLTLRADAVHKRLISIQHHIVLLPVTASVRVNPQANVVLRPKIA